MKKAVRIVSIVMIPVLVITFFSLLIASVIILNADPSRIEGSTREPIAVEEARLVLTMTATILLTTAASFIPGIVLDIVILSRNEKDLDVAENGHSIGLSVPAIIFGAVPTGILYIIRNNVARSAAKIDSQIE